MPRVTCPECQGIAEVSDDDLGENVYCPSCGEVFVAETPTVGRARRQEASSSRSQRYRDDDDDTDSDFEDRPHRRRRRAPGSAEEREDILDDARRAVFLPAIFSIIACIIGILYHIADAVIIWMEPQILQQNPLGGGNMPIEMYMGFRAFSILWEVLILIGSVCMMKLKSRQFALATMVMHIIPCAGVCCLIGLPVGVWALVTLQRADVTEGFTLIERDG
jgi:predicted Zn finger-like uncharacterized protein